MSVLTKMNIDFASGIDFFLQQLYCDWNCIAFVLTNLFKSAMKQNKQKSIIHFLCVYIHTITHNLYQREVRTSYNKHSLPHHFEPLAIQFQFDAIFSAQTQ